MKSFVGSGERTPGTLRPSFAAVAIVVALVGALTAACGTPGLGIDVATLGHGGAASSTRAGGAGHGGSGPSFSFGDLDGGLSDADSYGLCVPRTCAEIGATCGPQGDGCGNVIQCGSCKVPETCGGGSTRNACGGNNRCVPKTCADLNANCGPVGDGCGGSVQCGACTAPQSCGGGGTASVCGGNIVSNPNTCTSLGITCGPAGDGYGGLLQCGNCPAPLSCGGGGTPGVCGGAASVDGGSTCTPKKCTDLGITCGPTGDGCGGLLQCGVCNAPATCGGGGTPGVCGGTSGCVPKRCSDYGYTCGPAGDGCGNLLQCGDCKAPTTCGGGAADAGAKPGVCGGSNDCVPKTCSDLGFNCGPAGDGCGGLLQCGSTCPAQQICGGGGRPGVCGPTDAGSGCTGLCQQQVICANPSVTTTVSGTVFAPNGVDPIYGATVYVPSGPVAPFPPGVACDQCLNGVVALVTTTTAPDGTFQLTNVPVGNNIPVVIQLGRWRRQITVPTVVSCTNTALPANLTNFPNCHTGNPACPAGAAQGDIPLTAMVTGNADALECVLRKIGIDDSEFTAPPAGGPGADAGTAGRIQFYQSNGSTTAKSDAPADKVLFASQATLNAYDMVILSCDGTASIPPNQANPADGGTDSRLAAYTALGGRVFTTHYAYVWLDNYPAFSTTATWNLEQDRETTGTGYVDFTNPKGQAFAQWLHVVGASPTYGEVPLVVLRHDIDAVNSAVAQQWIYRPFNAGTVPMHYTFNTPVGAPSAQQCGRVLFSDFHVADIPNVSMTFPNECTTYLPAAGMNAQEHLIEFMLFDLASCITPTTPPTPPTCTKTTCVKQGFNCGPAGDGCGGQLNCGVCPKGETCGGGGQPGVCGGVACTPVGCKAQGIQCGPTGDGCGNLIQCGNCPNGQTCGGGGAPGQCGKPACTPTTCAKQNIQCGPAGNGCGGLLECGSCPPGETCGGGGVPGQCGASDAATCAPVSCQNQNIDCGPAGNGCGGQLDCGPCPSGQTCGGGGTPGKCGAPPCTQTTCTALGLQCGPAGDGCGGVLQCGTCPANEVCGGCGTPGTCGSCCVPLTCTEIGYSCGPAGDGCGNLLDCGACVAPLTCGGGGVSGQCGNGQTIH